MDRIKREIGDILRFKGKSSKIYPRSTKTITLMNIIGDINTSRIMVQIIQTADNSKFKIGQKTWVNRQWITSAKLKDLLCNNCKSQGQSIDKIYGKGGCYDCNNQHNKWRPIQ